MIWSLKKYGVSLWNYCCNAQMVMEQRAGYLVWTLGFGLFFILHWVLLPVTWLLLAYTEMLKYPWCDAAQGGGCGCLLLGTWWHSPWRAMLVSIHCWGRWLLWRDAQRCCVCCELDQGRATLLSLRYFPGIDLPHDPKSSLTFMIYGWNTGEIFHSLLCVHSCCFYMQSVIPLQKTKIKNYCCCWKPQF